MRLIRLTKKTGKPTVLGADPDLDINWASGPGFRDGPEDYFCLKVEYFCFGCHIDQMGTTV
jgi:hypothetical protein